MPKYTVRKECTFRFHKKEPAAHLFPGAVVEVDDGVKVPDWFMRHGEPLGTGKGETADNGGVSDIRSKKDVCAELDALNVVYKKTITMKELEDLLADAREARKEKKD